MDIAVSDLAIALRLSATGDDLDDAQTAVLTRLIGVATALVGKLRAQPRRTPSKRKQVSGLPLISTIHRRISPTVRKTLL